VNGPVLERWWGRRPNRYIAAFIGILLLLAAGSSLIHRSPSVGVVQPPATPLPPGTVVPSSRITEVQMQTMATGIGLAVVPRSSKSPARAYVVATTDGATTWRARSDAPASSQISAFSDSLVVLDPHVYYFVEAAAARLLVTSDGGRTWHPVVVVGRMQSARRVGRQLWVTTEHCAGTASHGAVPRCSAFLYAYAAGQLGAPAGRPVPESRSMSSTATASVLASLGPGAAVLLDAPGGPGHAAIVMTPDGGATWQSVPNPCGRAIPGALLTSSPRRWVLYCSLDEGMNQGLNQLFASLDRGATWRLVAAAEAGRMHHMGRFGDVMSAAIAMSNDGTIMWDVSTVGPMSASVDGGAVWSMARPNVPSMSPSGIDAVGPRGAFMVALGGGVWRTADGVHWRLLR